MCAGKCLSESVKLTLNRRVQLFAAKALTAAALLSFTIALPTASAATSAAGRTASQSQLPAPLAAAAKRLRINPDDIVKEYGADTLRTYEMFIGAFDLSASWSDDGVKGCRRFLDRVWKLQTMLDKDNDGYSKDLETKMHQTIKKVSSDFENLKYNTAIAAMMALINDFYKKNSITLGEYKTLITLLNPVAPHITEEIWEIIGGEGRLYEQSWPEYEEAKTVESTVEIAVQINGKTKVTLSIGKDDAKDDVLARAKEALGDRLDGKNIIKEIYVPGRIVNIVAK